MLARILKVCLGSVCLILVSPLLLVYQLLRRLWPTREEQVYQGCTQALALLPSLPGQFLRAAFLRATLQEFGTNVSVGFLTTFATSAVVLKDRVYIGGGCHLGHCSIGRNTLLANNVAVLSGKHAHGFGRIDMPMQDQEVRIRPLSIGDDVWIGHGAVIMANVGSHVIVGAGSVVVKDVPDYGVVAGNPAHLIRSRVSESGVA